MNDDRTVLTDAMRAQIKDMLPGKATDPGVTAANSQRFVKAALWRPFNGTLLTPRWRGRTWPACFRGRAIGSGIPSGAHEFRYRLAF